VRSTGRAILFSLLVSVAFIQETGEEATEIDMVFTGLAATQQAVITERIKHELALNAEKKKTAEVEAKLVINNNNRVCWYHPKGNSHCILLSSFLPVFRV